MIGKIYFVLIATFFIILPFVRSECIPSFECGEWGSCVDSFQSRLCVDQVCRSESVVERRLCKENCKSEVTCGTWSPCLYVERVDDIFAEKIRFNGYREKECRDFNGCIADYVETKDCEISYDVKFVKKEYCGKEYVIAVNPKSEELLGKIGMGSTDSFSVSFIQEDPKYCPSCFNSVKDNGEAGVDCGGQCKSCVANPEFYIGWSSIVGWSIVALAFIILIFLSIHDKKRKLKMRAL